MHIWECLLLVDHWGFERDHVIRLRLLQQTFRDKLTSIDVCTNCCKSWLYLLMLAYSKMLFICQTASADKKSNIIANISLK